MDGKVHQTASLDKSPEDSSPDPALEALIELLESERKQALNDRPELVAQVDPGQLWLLWFAIGATLEICSLLGRDAGGDGSALFRQIADRFFPKGVRSACCPNAADRRLVELFESAGAAAVTACMRGDARLGYYLAGLRVGADRGTPPLLN